jgi:uncharacterized protein with PQ loop repeat
MSSFKDSLINILTIVKNISLDIFMTFAPATNYVFQALTFRKTKSSKGFSSFLCLVTILAHTTKIFYWFGERYKYTLLVQSILVIIILLYILHLFLKYKEKPQAVTPSTAPNNKEKISKKEKVKKCICSVVSCKKTFNPHLIWRWDKLIEFYKFYFFIIMVLLLCLFAFGVGNKIFAKIIGYINLILEMLCSLPQIIEMYRTKNQRNISKIMVIFWFSGNILKIYYNYYNNSPIILLIGSFIQVFFNTILIGQLIYYYQMNKKESLTKKIPKNKETKETKDVNISELDDKPEETSRSFTTMKKKKKEIIIDNFNIINKN